MGYHRAGLEVVGVDHRAQPRYPFEFHQADAMSFPVDGFDFIHASPPCQAYHHEIRGQSPGDHPDLIAPVRAMLEGTGKLWIMENVPGAPMRPGVTTFLCGSAFGLDVRRHRFFESNVFLFGRDCDHEWQRPRFPPWKKGRSKACVVNVSGNGRFAGDNVALWRRAMRIDWMVRRELAQAIPPAYTEWLGHQVVSILENRGVL